MNLPAVIIKKDETQPAATARFWLYEEGQDAPYAYVQRCGSQWWGCIPGSSGRYFATRNEAIGELA